MRQLCVFAGAAKGIHDHYERESERLGGMLAARNFSVIYGGGRTGLMGAFSRGALNAGGHVTGIIPHFLESLEVGNGDIQKLLIVESMHERKATMYKDSAGFVVLPGGLGTLDEMMEVMTWKQLGLLQAPVFALDIAGYWQPLLGMMEHAESQGFIHNRGIIDFHVGSDPDHLVDLIDRHLGKNSG